MAETSSPADDNAPGTELARAPPPGRPGPGPATEAASRFDPVGDECTGTRYRLRNVAPASSRRLFRPPPGDAAPGPEAAFGAKKSLSRGVRARPPADPFDLSSLLDAVEEEDPPYRPMLPPPPRPVKKRRASVSWFDQMRDDPEPPLRRRP